jgi:hypothetical protein
MWGQSKAVQKSGSLSGTVVDASGAVVAEARVTLRGIRPKQFQITDKNGVFSFASLPSGRYSVAIQKEGFKPAHVQGIEIVSGKISAIRIGLLTPKQAQVFEITDDPVTVDTTSSASRSCITDQNMRSLPMDRSIGGAISTAGRCP